MAGEENLGRVTATVTVPSSVATVNLRLVDAANVTTSTSGAVTFTSAAALLVAGGASMELINGVVGSTAAAGLNTFEKLAVTPINGVVTVVIDGITVQELVLVAWADTKTAGVANQLDLDSAGAPEDAFGTSAVIRYNPPSAVSAANPGAGRVVSTDKAAGRIFTDTAGAAGVGDFVYADADFGYSYDSNDTFNIAGAPATFAEFSAALSRGDVLDPGSYTTNAALVSVFDISFDGSTLPAHVATPTNLSIAVVITPRCQLWWPCTTPS